MDRMTKHALDALQELSERQRNHGGEAIAKAYAALAASPHISVEIIRERDGEARWDFVHENDKDLVAFQYEVWTVSVRNGRHCEASAYLNGCWEDSTKPDWYMSGYLPQKICEALKDHLTMFYPKKPHV